MRMELLSADGIGITLALVATAISLFYIYAKYKLSYWKRRGVESLPTNLIFGNFKDAVLFRTAPGWHLGNLHKAAKKDVPYLGFYIFHKPCFLLRDPEVIKQILIRDFENFSDRHFAGSEQKDSIGMKNLFGIKNPNWKYLRAKITPTLTRGKLKQMFPLMLETGEPMMKYLENQPENKNGVKVIDAQELSYKYTTDLIASIALGTKMDSFHYPNEEFSKAVMEFFHGFKRMVALVTVFFMPELVEMIGTRMLFNSSFVKKIFWEAMESRERTGNKRGDFIDSLLQLKNGEQNSDYKFEGENLLYQSGTFFSGFESSSTTMSFTLMELANHPEYQERVRQDINKAIDAHGFTFDAFNEMKYLDQAIAEGVRLHPPVSTIDRYTRKDYKIPGTDIILEKGTPIYISLYGLQEDPRFFKDHSTFNPDRFTDDSKVADAYIPFGSGPRMCVGMKVGQLHAKVVIAMLLREYEIWQKPEDKSILDPRSTFTAAANGIVLQFRKLVKYTVQIDLVISYLMNSITSSCYVVIRHEILFSPNVTMETSTSHLLIYVVTFILSLVGLLYIYIRYKLSYWSRRGVKTPPVHLLFGNFKDTITFKKAPGNTLRDIHENADADDPYIGFYIFQKRYLMLRNLDIIKQIFIKDFDLFPNRNFGGKREIDSVGLINLLGIRQPGWKYLRQKITPFITGQKLRRMIPLMVDSGYPMTNFIDDKSTDSEGWKEVELKDISSRYSTDVISSLAFGVTTNSFNKNDTAFWKAGLKILSGTKRNIILMIVFLLPELIDIIYPIMTGPAQFFREVFWDSMNTREKAGYKRGDLIDSLLQLKNAQQNPIFKFEGDNLLGQAVAFYVAGYEASSTAIAFTLYELARHPEYQERVFQEIQTEISKNGIDYNSINEMSFLDKVVIETLRMHPPLPLVDRFAIEDYKIPGTDLIIEKGTPVIVSTNGINRDPKYYSNPDEFDPERTQEGKEELIGASLTFGIGPRSCVGQRIGTLMTKVGVITILSNYELSYKCKENEDFNAITIFTAAADGVVVHLKKREKPIKISVNEWATD
ncbi:uncharacterized protein LOC107269568 [Cephus cinctus]|uniref:Uncharacterized protein LOC107269568 n=2 Tax=Cephus cinctus TaxID=211228 RepID=A0AAJ7RKM9_CEPCN|nr:uncharacterized protein LOC107269568 [Cephus cinctus]